MRLVHGLFAAALLRFQSQNDVGFPIGDGRCPLFLASSAPSTSPNLSKSLRPPCHLFGLIMVLTQRSCWRRSQWGSWRSPWQPPLGPLRGLAHSARKALVASSQLHLISVHGAFPCQHALARSFPHSAPSPSPSPSLTESASRTSELHLLLSNGVTGIPPGGAAASGHSPGGLAHHHSHTSGTPGFALCFCPSPRESVHFDRAGRTPSVWVELGFNQESALFL